MMAGERELTTGLLSKEANFRLIVSGAVGVKEIERLIRKLELDKEILADADDDGGSSTSRRIRDQYKDPEYRARREAEIVRRAHQSDEPDDGDLVG